MVAHEQDKNLLPHPKISVNNAAIADDLDKISCWQLDLRNEPSRFISRDALAQADQLGQYPLGTCVKEAQVITTWVYGGLVDDVALAPKRVHGAR